ncbi:MAG: Hpt domain-containing protein [Mycobacteriales bacterium]
MGDQGVHVGGQSVAGAVPPAVLADLRRAFAGEVRRRLPRLTAGSDLEAARRDAHALASGAWIVGEPEIARLARQVESALPEGPVGELVEALSRYVA